MRRGYKQTDVGVIPEDWVVQPFSRVLRNMNGKAHQVQTSEYLATGSFPVIDQGKESVVGYSDREDRLFSSPDGGVIVFGDHTCIVKYINFDFVVGADGTQILAGREGQLTRFHALALEHRGIEPTGYSRHFKYLKERPFLCPPLPEQRAIAGVLSDVDAALAGLGRLIAKKKDLKLAAMQQLLTGQTRLPGFTAPWEVKRLGEVLRVRHGKSQHAVEVADGPFPILATGGQIGTASRPLYDKPSVLIGRKGTIDQPQYMDTPFWTVDTLFYTEMQKENDAKFIFYRAQMIEWRKHNEASGVPSLNAKTIESIEVLCPLPDEQTAIAAVLSDMDAELAALNAQLEKTKHLKQAMMQVLLTGRTRLPLPPEAEAPNARPF